MQKKDLYLAKSLAGLEQHYSLDPNIINRPIPRFVNIMFFIDFSLID